MANRETPNKTIGQKNKSTISPHPPTHSLVTPRHINQVKTDNFPRGQHPDYPVMQPIINMA